LTIALEVEFRLVRGKKKGGECNAPVKISKSKQYM